MNDTYGEPTNLTIPFNHVDRRFPITYTLAEDASDEERKTQKKLLTGKFESALRLVFESAEYAQEQESHTPTAMDVAALHRKDLEFEQALSSLRYGEGPRKARENVEALFAVIKAKCDEVESEFGFGIGCGWESKPREDLNCVIRNHSLGVIIAAGNSHTWTPWRTRNCAFANIKAGCIFLVSLGGGHILPPKVVREAVYKPTLSREYELGWVKAGKMKREPSFISNKEMAETCDY